MFHDNKYFSIQQASPRERRNNILILIFILVFGLLNVYFNPLKYFFTDVIGIASVNGCPLLTFTNIPCPMCGLGRVFSCITDFYLIESFYYNPLGLVFYIILGFVLAVLFIINITGKKLVLKKPAIKLWYIPGLFLVVMWVLNILFGHHH